ncbi:MAG: hypothetical protein M1814_004422 [Vezdaea aestivalis]|nr:MAG: hypothetical protein M1814_004422 [Vezdaea aestivalis]
MASSSPIRPSDISTITTAPPPAHHRTQTTALTRLDDDPKATKDDLPETRPRGQALLSNRARVPIRPSASTPALAPYEFSHGKRRKNTLGAFPTNLEFKPPRESVYPLQGIKVILDQTTTDKDAGSAPPRIVAKQRQRALSLDSYLADRAFKKVVVGSYEEVDGVLGRTSFFDNLPSEIHEAIIDFVLGIDGGGSRSRGGSVSREWNVRHLRTSRLSGMALVCPTWRKIIQSRLYRHLKVKGTVVAVQKCRNWFMQHDHLRHHVRHFEVWFPVWEKSALATQLDRSIIPNLSPPYLQTPYDTETGLHARRTCNEKEKLSSRNASLMMVLCMVNHWFPDTHTFTIEGGDCRNARMITYHEGRMESLPVLERVQRLILKGTWNIMRNRHHAIDLFRCFPRLRDWHCAFAMARGESYSTISKALPLLPFRLTRLDLSLESFTSTLGPSSNGSHSGGLGSSMSTDELASGHSHSHLCEALGAAMGQIQCLSYTGTLCACFFTAAAKAAKESRDGSPLQYVDLTIKNCCRPIVVEEVEIIEPKEEEGEESEEIVLLESEPHTGAWGRYQASVTNQAFMTSFLRLIVFCARNLDTLDRLNNVRIRFVDLGR